MCANAESDWNLELESFMNFANDCRGSHKSGRVVLSNEDARAIFMSKPNCINRGHVATNLARQYGVSPKTIRDIWHRKTWFWATHDLEGCPTDSRIPRKMGRPKGAKDSHPRIKKQDGSKPFRGPLEYFGGENVSYKAMPEKNDARCDSSQEIDAVENAFRPDDFNDPFHDDWAFWSYKEQF
jgi:hypothetical protein